MHMEVGLFAQPTSTFAAPVGPTPTTLERWISTKTRLQCLHVRLSHKLDEVFLATCRSLEVSRLTKLFLEKNWFQAEDSRSRALCGKTFDAFCELFNRLNEAEREVIFNLATDFLHCTSADHKTRIRDAIDTIPAVKYEAR